MQIFFLRTLVALSIHGCSRSAPPAPEQAPPTKSTTAVLAADTIYTNGRIYTVNEERPQCWGVQQSVSYIC